MRTMAERSERQQALKERNEEQWDPEFMTLADCARILKVCRATVRKMFCHEPGVEVWRMPGSRRAIIRIPREVFERVLRRAANPWTS